MPFLVFGTFVLWYQVERTLQALFETIIHRHGAYGLRHLVQGISRIVDHFPHHECEITARINARKYPGPEDAFLTPIVVSLSSFHSHILLVPDCLTSGLDARQNLV